MCVTLGPLKFEGSIPTTICSTFASNEALQTSITKARRAPRVLHFFVFQAARWYGGLRTPKKTISRMYGGRPCFCTFFFLTVPLRCAFEKLKSRMYGGRTDFCGRTDGRTHTPMQHRRAPQHPQKSTVPSRLSFIWLSFWGPRLSGNSLRALSGTPNLISSTFACHEAIHTLFASLWDPSNQRGRFRQLFTALSLPLKRSKLQSQRHGGLPEFCIFSFSKLLNGTAV